MPAGAGWRERAAFCRGRRDPARTERGHTRSSPMGDTDQCDTAQAMNRGQNHVRAMPQWRTPNNSARSGSPHRARTVPAKTARPHIGSIAPKKSELFSLWSGENSQSAGKAQPFLLKFEKSCLCGAGLGGCHNPQPARNLRPGMADNFAEAAADAVAGDGGSGLPRCHNTKPGTTG
jgi:hypothetical protein